MKGLQKHDPPSPKETECVSCAVIQKIKMTMAGHFHPRHKSELCLRKDGSFWGEKSLVCGAGRPKDAHEQRVSRPCGKQPETLWAEHIPEQCNETGVPATEKQHNAPWTLRQLPRKPSLEKRWLVDQGLQTPANESNMTC